MTDKNTATIEALLRFALPLGTSLLVGEPNITINWAVNIRAQPPAFPDIYGGELALVSMDVLRSFDNRITLSEVIRGLSEADICAVAATEDAAQTAIAVANEYGVCLLSLPDDSSLTSVERAVNSLILNQSARLTERAIEIQRQLTRLAAENRDLNSLLQVMARATAKAMVIHDDASVLMAQVYPHVTRRNMNSHSLLKKLPHDAFQKWLENESPSRHGQIVASPIGHTTVLQVEKRIAGYLSLIDQNNTLDEFDRLVLTYGADVCAIELAKTRAIASAVEQARGDWVQMWLSGTPVDDDLLTTRAQRAGFDPDSDYVVCVFRASVGYEQSLPVESLVSLVRDDMSRRQINGAVGQYVDIIVSLYPISDPSSGTRIRQVIDDVRTQLASRTPSGLVAAGISRPALGLSALREAYREAKDAVGIAAQLGDTETTTFYGDLKLYQLLLALKERNLGHLQHFHDDTIGPIIEHDARKKGELIETLNGFFEANGNLAKASQVLNVHRNTLVYRLEKISELAGIDLNDADNRLILHLALKLERVLATVSR